MWFLPYSNVFLLFFFEQAFVVDKISTSVDLETVVRFSFYLGLFICIPPNRQQFSPWVHATHLIVFSKSLAFFSHVGWTSISACKTKSSLRLCSDSSHVSFLTPSALWSHRWCFAELFWHCWGITFFWYKEEKQSVNINFFLQLLFTRVLSEMER